jgi:hypothetical protein
MAKNVGPFITACALRPQFAILCYDAIVLQASLRLRDYLKNKTENSFIH